MVNLNPYQKIIIIEHLNKTTRIAVKRELSQPKYSFGKQIYETDIILWPVTFAKTDWILKASQNALQGWEASKEISWRFTKNTEKSRANLKIYVSAINLRATSKKKLKTNQTHIRKHSNKERKNNKGDTL